MTTVVLSVDIRLGSDNKLAEGTMLSEPIQFFIKIYPQFKTLAAFK